MCDRHQTNRQQILSQHLLEKGEKRVFYFKPDTFMLDDPEKQRIYREKLIKRITSVPMPEPIMFMGDDLHKQILESVQDKSQPTMARKHLAQYFKRRHYTLQHKKYKVLIRWAHNALTAEYLERMGHEATFKYGKLEYEMENAMNRYDRLEGEDDFDGAPTYPRPNTKAKEGGSLYVENTELEPVSTIRMDDVEVYLRQVTYDQKVNKLMNKYISRLKWLSLQKRFEIFSEAVEEYNKLKERNMSQQEQHVKKIRERGESLIPKNSVDMHEELNYIIENYYIVKYKSKIISKADQIMNSQKVDHELAPQMIDNSLELKVQILHKALDYGIYGDIELDQGYSFAYQITIFFPTYFQRQIIKSQFSLYDAFAGEDQDQNSIQKRNLQNMIKIDTNIFRDISTSKNNIPNQESLNLDDGFRNLKIVRLKSSASWIDYCVAIQPTLPIYLQKQAAFLSINNPIDSLLKSALNFLDVNDLATVNRILEETARLHQQQQKDKYTGFSIKNKKRSQAQQQRKPADNSNKPTMQEEAKNMREHFQSALKGDISQEQKDPLKEMPNVSLNSLRYLPQHLIHAYYILRHMKSRDYKTKLLYCLNYFRAIQKRLMLDLREFGTRERILGDVTQPLIPPTEADKAYQINSNNTQLKSFSDQQSKDGTNLQSKSSEDQMKKEQEMHSQIFEDGQIKTDFGLIDMKKFKFKGKFNNKIFSTCPVIPRFHATFGEPIEQQPLNVEMERIGSIKHATDESMKLIGRVDHVEIDATNMEVFIKDDFGIHILYDCCLQDMKELEDELLKVGSYYISKHEFLVNTENDKPYPLIDRLTLMQDLLNCEHQYQFLKVQLISTFMECYEHISDPLEQQRLMQIIIDMMAQRPRLNLSTNYFKDSYQAEIQCLTKHIELMKLMVRTQVSIEKEENNRTHAYLDLTYRIVQAQQKGKWTYADAEDFYNELKKRKMTQNLLKGSQDSNNFGSGDVIAQQVEQPQAKEEEMSPTKRFLKKIGEKQHGSQHSASSQLKNQLNDTKSAGSKNPATEEGGFAAVLGLPPITVESLYQQFKEKDEVILDIMNENANFIRIYEGYPDRMQSMQGLSSTKLQNHKFADWSVPINLLDFCDSLSFVTKFHASIHSVYTDLQDVLKPHDNTMLTLIEQKIFEKAEIEFKKVLAFYKCEVQEFEGADYLESENIVGNADKVVFYVKDLVSHLEKTIKPNINPFYIGKLDIETINFFEFPQTAKDQNPYVRKNIDYLKEDMDSSVKVADQHMRQNVAAYQRFFPTLKEYMRKINTPSLLTLYCNSMEMLRLRTLLLQAISETVLLAEVYENQCKQVNRQNYKVQFTDQINFDNYLIDNQKVNYIDDGPSRNVEMDIAINEFDHLLKSNLNFRNPDAIKMLICTSGLEELRGVLHYQLMQKQLLIIGVHINQLLLDTHMRALSELELVKKGYSLPSMIIKVQNLLSKTGDGFSMEGYQREKQKYQSNLINEAGPVFYYVGTRKSKLRNTVSKKFSVFLTSVASTHSKPECSLRVLRSYKLKLLHAYCTDVMKEAYFDSMKVQMLSTCKNLRLLTQIFNIDENSMGIAPASHGSDKVQIFSYEHHEFFENFFAAYNPLNNADAYHFSKDHATNTQAISTLDCQINNYFMIPSSITIMKCESLSQEESSLLSQKHSSFQFHSNPEDNDVEKSLKESLPMITHQHPEYPREENFDKDRQGLRLFDFLEGYDYPQFSAFAQTYSYYAMVERILHLEYFVAKLSSNLQDTLNLEQTIFCGLPFWNQDFDAEMQQANKDNSGQLAEKILNKIVTEKRARVNLADDVLNLSATMFQILKKLQTQQQSLSFVQDKPGNSHLIPKWKVLEYLFTYQEYRFFFLLHTLDKVLDSYYQKEGAKEVKYTSDVQNELANRNHIKFSFAYNQFHVNGAITRKEKFSLETSNYLSYYGNFEENRDFNICVQPIINEAAVNPPQITLIEGMYTHYKLKKPQFAGQIPQQRMYSVLQTAFINMSEQERSYVNSTAHSIKGFLKDYLDVLHKETVDFNDEGLTLNHLRKCRKFLGELIQGKQLKNALMCWLSNSTLPYDPKVYQTYLQQYKNDIFWKIMNMKDQLPSPYNPDKQQSSKALDPDQKRNNKEIVKQAEQSMILSQQLQNMQIQVLVDQVQTSRAEIIVLASEIERQIVKAAIKSIETESGALANCFSINAKSIEYHIHPFQQFASTCYPQVDRNSHLDMVTKVSEVQRFITRLRNRGTEVETLTSGPGMVFTIKDFNECLQILCRGLIKYGEKEMRSRSEYLAKREQHYMSIIYVKDRKLENLEQRIENTRDNLDKLINSKMYEKGNQLIYELDCVNRQLRLFKDNIFAMEKELRSSIRAEFAETLRKNMRDLDTSINRFNDFKQDVTTKVKADLAQEQHKIEKILKKKAEEYKNLSTSTANRVSPLKQRHEVLQRQITQEDKLNKSKQQLTYLEEINEMSEREARQELAQMWDIMRKMRIFWKTKEVIMVDKFEKEIFTLKKQQTSNACLWEQLAEAEKREKVLKQELVFTQQSLAASEKVIEKLKEDLRKSESDRVRLNQYKQNKSQRLEELEGKVRKFEVLENINLEKLIDTLASKDKEIGKLKDIERNFNEKLDAIENRKDIDIKIYREQYMKEIGMKRDVLERLEGLRMELRMLEKNEGSMAEVWKSKCKELVDISNKLKSENDVLRSRLIQMTQSQQTEEHDYEPTRQYQEGGLVHLPKLLPNVNQSKMLSNIHNSKYGSTTVHTRHSSVAKHNDSQFVAGSLDRSIIGGSMDPTQMPSASSSKYAGGFHQRQRSQIDSANISKFGENSFVKFQPQTNIAPNIAKQPINSQRFGIKGQQAQIGHGRGYQSVRVSHNEVQKISQEDGEASTAHQQARAIFKNAIEMNNTSTSINKSLMNQSFNNNGKTPPDQTQYGVLSNNKSIYSKNSDLTKSAVGTGEVKKKRLSSQERYGNNGNKSAGGNKKKSNDDIDVLIQSEANSPSKRSSEHNQNNSTQLKNEQDEEENMQ